VYYTKDSLFWGLPNLSCPLQDKLGITLQEPEHKILAIPYLRLASSIYCHSCSGNLNRGILTLDKVLYKDLIGGSKRNGGYIVTDVNALSQR